MSRHFLTSTDVGAFILRITIGGLLILHGLHKLMYGVEGQMGLLASNGIPGQLIYFVYLSEVLAPVLLLLGVYTRLSSLAIIITMVTILYVIPVPFFGLDKHGALNLELQLFYLLIPVALFFIGPGRYRLRRSNAGHWLLD